MTVSLAQQDEADVTGTDALPPPAPMITPERGMSICGERMIENKGHLNQECNGNNTGRKERP